GEAAVAVTTLALGSGQRVFLAGVRVQEYREVLPDRAEAGLQQLVRRGADHYPVAFMPGHAQQLIADGAANQIGLEVCFHGRSLGRGGVVLQGGMQPPIAGMEPGTPWKRRPAGSVEHQLDEGVADSAGGRAGARPSQGRSDRRYVHVEAGDAFLGFAGSGWHVLFFLERIAVPALQMDIETPEPVQVPEHTLGGLAQRLALMALVTQGQ